MLENGFVYKFINNLPVNFLAVDIGKTQLKLAKVSRNGGNATLDVLSQVEFPSNLESVVPKVENETEIEMLSSSIKSLVETSGIKTKQVVSNLPESVIFTKLFNDVPRLDAAKFEETIYWEAKQFVPIPMDEAQTDYIEIRSHKSQEGNELVDVMFIAAPKNVVEAYLMLFDRADLELIALEVQSVALARAANFNHTELSQNALLIEFGHNRTDISALYNGNAVFSQSVSTGSESFTKAISTDFGLQFAQAEQYKRTYGVLPNMDDGGKIMNSIKPILDVVVNEISKVYGFINTRMSYGAPQNIIISGGGALMPGLSEYLNGALGLPVIVIDPLAKINLSRSVQGIKQQVNVPSYSTVLGLALKDE